MARWSDLMKLSDYRDYKEYLSCPGCYEIGFAQGGFFSPKYVGRGQNIYERIKTYMNPNRCHNEYIAANYTPSAIIYGSSSCGQSAITAWKRACRIATALAKRASIPGTNASSAPT